MHVSQGAAAIGDHNDIAGSQDVRRPCPGSVHDTSLRVTCTASTRPASGPDRTQPMPPRKSATDKVGYPIGVVARLTNIHPETLRIWERRYGIVCPDRTGRGSRLYSQDDVRRLALVKALVDAGHPVISLSIGDTARFLFGGVRRRDPVEAMLLESGDAFVFGGAARLRYHGVSRIVPGTAPRELELDGRFNLTFREY